MIAQSGIPEIPKLAASVAAEASTSSATRSSWFVDDNSSGIELVSAHSVFTSYSSHSLSAYLQVRVSPSERVSESEFEMGHRDPFRLLSY